MHKRSMLIVLTLILTMVAGCHANASSSTPTGCGPYFTSTPSKPSFADIAPSSVSMLSPTDGWVVGSAPINGVTALHLQKSKWVRVPVPASVGGFRDVVALSPTNVWGVTDAGVVHFDGTSWTVVYTDLPGNPSALDLQALSMDSPGDGWAVGMGGVLHDANGFWTNASAQIPPRPGQQPSPVLYPGLRDVSMLSARDGWAVGNDGVIWHYDGTQWRSFASPSLSSEPTNEIALTAIWMDSPDDGWAVGGPTTKTAQWPAVIEHYTSGKWAVFTRLTGNPYRTEGKPSLGTVVMSSPTEGWAAGASVHESEVGCEAATIGYSTTSLLLHYTNGKWTEVAVPNVGTIHKIAMDSPDDGWAAADGGLLHYHNGTWTAVLD